MEGRKGMTDKEFMEEGKRILYVSEKYKQLEELQRDLANQGLSSVAHLEKELKRRKIKNPFEKYNLNSLAPAEKPYIINPDDEVLTTQEACAYLRISRPTYMNYINEGRIKGTKAGKGWKIFKSELDRFLRGDGRKYR